MPMRPERLVRHYGKLAPAERARLAVRTLARDDFDELRRLRTTCPKKTYQESDAEYVDQMEASRILASRRHSASPMCSGMTAST